MKKFLVIILILASVLLIILFMKDMNNYKEKESEISEIVNIFDNQITSINNNLYEINDNEEYINSTNSNNSTVKTSDYVSINGLNVYGKIKIDKIKIEYPIIEYVNDDSLSVSICKISDNEINGEGNLCLAGHNMRNLSMFGKLKKVEIGDTIEITNSAGKKYIYQVTEKFYIDYNQTEILDETVDPTLTLITCKSLDNSKRLILKARAYECNRVKL